MRPVPDFVAGNVRLRARVPAVDALAREADPAVRREQAAVLLRAVPALYTDTAREVVAVLLARHDLADSLALVRGAVRHRPLHERMAAVTTLGAITPEIANDAAHAPDCGVALNRLAAHGLPSPDAAALAALAWQSYQLHGDEEELEMQLAGTAHRDWERRLGSARGPGGPVLRLLRAERDLANLVTVLRVPWNPQPRLLPYADLGAAELSAASRADLQPALRARPQWSSVVHALGAAPRGVEVERALRLQLAHEGNRTLRHGDIFGADIAVGFVLTVEQLRADGLQPPADRTPAGFARGPAR